MNYFLLKKNLKVKLRSKDKTVKWLIKFEKREKRKTITRLLCWTWTWTWITLPPSLPPSLNGSSNLLFKSSNHSLQFSISNSINLFLLSFFILQFHLLSHNQPYLWPPIFIFQYLTLLQTLTAGSRNLSASSAPSFISLSLSLFLFIFSLLIQIYLIISLRL